MRNDQSTKHPLNHLEATRLPGYNSTGSLQHPNEMRVSGRYGQTSIPASAFLNRSLYYQGVNASYNLGKSISAPHLPSHQAHQAHHALPLYNYGIQQQCVPCGPAYRLPVYYEQPMQVREEWQRPLDPHVKEQQWRFVRTQDKGGIVKYVPRDQEFVETQPGKWEQYYGPKTAQPPVIPPTREKRTCCTPLLFGLLGLLALIGLILGLILLLNAHKSMGTPNLSGNIKSSSVEPTAVQLQQELPAIPIMPQTTVTTKPNPVTRPTFAQPITARPSEEITTSTSTLSASQELVMNTPAVTINYGYSQASSPGWNSGVNYNNDYQIRDSTGLTGANGYSGAFTTLGSQNEFSSVSTLPATRVQTLPSEASSTMARNPNTDFRVPAGYRIDQFGMIVPV